MRTSLMRDRIILEGSKTYALEMRNFAPDPREALARDLPLRQQLPIDGQETLGLGWCAIASTHLGLKEVGRTQTNYLPGLVITPIS
jgi:hypothetical protein